MRRPILNVGWRCAKLRGEKKRGGDMRAVVRWLSALAFGLFLFGASIIFQPAALAQTQEEYQQAVAAFIQKRATANSVLGDLTSVVGCLGQQEGKLQARDKELEGIIGHWAAEEKRLAPEVVRQQGIYNDFERNYGAAEKDFKAKSDAVENMPGRKQYLRWKRSCDPKDKEFSVNICRWGNSNMFNEVARAERELPGALERRDSARKKMNDELNNLHGAQKSLKDAQKSLEDATAERHAKEGEFTRLRQSIADINNARQPLGVEIDEFNNALTAAGKVDLADERPRTLRKLQDISGKIDGILERSRAAVSQSKPLIPAESHQACRVS
jgi:hypothetical protein